MFENDTLYENEEEITYWQNKLHRCENLWIDDIHFHVVALNMSGQREELEEKAKKLIDKVGFIEALKQTRIIKDPLKCFYSIMEKNIE